MKKKKKIKLTEAAWNVLLFIGCVSVLVQLFCLFYTIDDTKAGPLSLFGFAGAFAIVFSYGAIVGLLYLFTPKRWW